MITTPVNLNALIDYMSSVNKGKALEKTKAGDLYIIQGDMIKVASRKPLPIGSWNSIKIPGFSFFKGFPFVDRAHIIN